MKTKKAISVLLVFCMLLSTFTMNFNYAFAAEDTSMADMDALSALGIDTSKVPEGYNENDTSNPYGKDSVTINPVSELYVLGLNQITTTHPQNFSNSLVGTVYGHNDYSSKTTEDVMKNEKNMTIASGTTTVSGTYVEMGGQNYLQPTDYKVANSLDSLTTGEFTIGSSKIAGGNFDGNDEGKSRQNVLLYTGENSENGGLYIRIGDNYTDENKGEYGQPIELIPKTKSIGNPSRLITDIEEDFATSPYLMQNYLQLTTGDYNGDGIDEIAVFIPELNNSRIVVYRLKTTTGQEEKAYKNPGQWEVAWTYSLKEEGYVSNMVSLVSGDFNKDGKTDIGATWGYYYGPNNNKGSKAVIMFGATSRMLQSSQEFDLTFDHPKYGKSDIVRASFTYGDLTGSGEELLILGGQADADIKRSNLNTRYVAIYSWNGTSFVSNVSKNFDLFEKDDKGQLVNSAMSIDNGVYYSSPLCPANLAVVKQGLSEAPYLYLDSLQISYSDAGLEIVAPLDQYGHNAGNKDYYVEYGAVSGDMTGLGYETLVTMQQTMSKVETEGHVSVSYYYKSWFHKLLGIRTYYISSSESCYSFTPNKTYISVLDFSNSNPYQDKWEVDTSTSICMQNTDNDTSFMQYTGRHYFIYSDPKIMAVLASPPYFSDLLDRDDLSGNYAESTTSYSSTKGEGGGDTFNTTIEAGAYVSYEQSFEVFGVEVAKVEAEATVMAGFTYETEESSTLEQTVSYSATAGEDVVVLFSIPLEVYEYTAYTSNGDGTYTEQAMTVNIPRTTAVQVMPLDTYENIAKDYENILPKISGSILTHTVGEPSTYSSSESGYLKAKVYNGDWARVGYSGAGGGAAISQEISWSKESTDSYNFYGKIEAKAGAGGGGLVVGVTAGAEIGGGWFNVTTAGNSFSGEIQNMPAEAEEFGYSHVWKIFSYMYEDANISFPVVSYLVKDVVAPARLPDDFKQNVEKTTDNQIALTWTYDKLVAGFQIYRYYEFPDGSGSYELKFVPMSDGVYNASDKLYHFEYIDKNLNPYQDYQYQIQTVRASVPNNSIPSEVLTVRTKTDVGYPRYKIEGLDLDGKLRIYPDSESTIKVMVENAEDYPSGISYQWQKNENGVWTNMNGKTTNELRFKSSGIADQAVYRCRTNVIYFDEGRGNEYYISSYSPEFTTLYSKRTPLVVENSFKAVPYEMSRGGNGLKLSIELVSGNTNHFEAPTGTVTFTVKGTDYERSFSKPLVKSATPVSDGDLKDKFTSKATVDVENLPDGVYEISAIYSGSRVFKSLSTQESIDALIGDSGYQLLLNKGAVQSVSFTYGDLITPIVKKYENIGGNIITTTLSSDIKYYLDDEKEELELNGGTFRTPNVGSYTLKVEYDDNFLVQKEFTISKRDISVKAIDRDDVGKGYVSPSNLPKLELLSSTMAFDEKLEDLKLEIEVRNTAGNLVIPFDNNTNPGSYTIIGKASEETDPVIYNNYNVAFIAGTYIIVAEKYDVDIIAEKYQGRDVGTIALSNSPDGKGGEFSASTELMFFATPYTGYDVDSWSIVVAETGREIMIEPSQLNTSKTRLTYTLKSEDITVSVRFKKSETRLETAKIGEGTITWDDPAFTNGAIVSNGARIDFTALAEDGYTFKEWRIEQGGITTIKAGIANPDGSNTFNFTMGNLYTIVRAVFERDSYTITLSDNLEAVYTYFDDFEGKDVERIVYNGSKILGGTNVTVRVRTGYTVADDSVWMVNGEPKEDVPDSGYTFVILENTSVSVETRQQSYTINTAAQHGSIRVQIGNDQPVTEDEIENVPGGSRLVFTAVPAHGYAFVSFQVEGTDKYTESANTLTISELGSDVTVTAYFTKNTDYTIQVNYGSRASIEYVLYDPMGNEVERDVVDPGDTIEVSNGDKVTLNVTPNAGFMVEKWIIDGTPYITNSNTYDLVNIAKNMTVTVDVISQISYTVNYQALDGGSIVSATSEGIPFASGDKDIGGNSKIVISAEPDTDYMVDYWTFNGQVVRNDDGYDFVGKALTIENLTSDRPTVDIKVYFTDYAEHTVEYDETNVDIDGEFIPDDASEGRVRKGAKAVFTITPDEGYRIVDAGVDISEEDYTIIKNPGNPDDEYGTWTIIVYSVESDITVSAEAKKIYSISIDHVYGGEFLSTTETTYSLQANEGEKVIIEPLADLDRTFVGWDVYDDLDNPIRVDEEEGEFSFIMPDADVTISGEFEDISTVDITIEVYDVNDEAEGGYNGTFSAVIDRDGISGYPEEVVSNTTGGAITNVNRGYRDQYVSWPATRLTIDAEPDEDFRVLKWTVNGTVYTSPLDFPVPSDSINTFIMDVCDDEDIEIVIQFEQIGERIFFGVDGGNGRITSATNESTGNEFISGNTVSSPTLITFEAKANSGYEVEAWLVDGVVVKSGNYESFQYEADGIHGADVKVRFARAPFVVRYSGINGSVTSEQVENGKSVRGDTNVTFTAEANPGYRFESFTITGNAISSSTSNPLTITITNNTNVTANFVPFANCQVNFSVIGGNGTLTATNNGADFASGDSADGDDVVVLTAVPNNNYKVKEWIVDGKSVSDSSSYTLRVSRLIHEISVEFERSHFVIDFSASGNGTIAAASDSKPVSSGSSLLKGSSITFSASPTSGYQVKNWQLNGADVAGTNEKTTFTLDNISSDTQVMVVFEPIPEFIVTIVKTGTGEGTVKAYVNGIESTLINNTITVKNHDKIVLEAVPKDEYNNATWSVAGIAALIDGTRATIDDVTANGVATVRFGVAELITVEAYARSENEEPARGTIRVKAGYGSDLETVNAVNTTENVTKGKTVQFTAVPDEGYKVKKWVINGVEFNNTNDTITRVPETNIKAEVYFEAGIQQNQPEITIKAAEKGQITVTYSYIDDSDQEMTITVNSGDSVPVGVELTVTAVPNAGYRLAAWGDYASNKSGSTIKLIVPDNDITISARFEFERSTGGGGGAFVPAPVLYTINAKAGFGGSITPKTASVEAGGSQSFTIAADEGFVISDVLVNGTSLGPVASYTLKDVQKDSSIEAVFAQKPVETPVFSDVNDDDWFAGAVKFVVSLGLFKGTAEDTFSPYTSMTRGMFVTVLGRLYEYMKDISLPASEGSSFSDVSPDQYYAAAVKWASENNIISGYENRQFKPDEPITREQIVAVMYRFAVYTGLDTRKTSNIDGFGDSDDVSAWALEAFRWAVGSGIVGGRTDGTLDPQGPVQRCEVAAILQRFIEQVTAAQ